MHKALFRILILFLVIPALCMGIFGSLTKARAQLNFGVVFTYRFDGEELHDYAGQTVGIIGDQDGDSREDILVDGPSTNPGGKTKAGTVYVYSSATGNLIRKFDGLAENDGLGVGAMSAIGDQDNDSREDLLVGAFGADPGGKDQAGSAYIYSTGTGNLIRQFDGTTAGDMLGSSVASINDLNGDGKKEAVVGAYGVHDGIKADTGAVYIYSSLDGSLLRTILGPNANDQIGVSLAVINDQNGDGSQEIVIGAPLSSPGGKASAGTVLIHSPTDGSLMKKIEGTVAGAFFGRKTSRIADLNSDNKEDVIIGAPYENVPGFNVAGAFYIYSTVVSDPLLTVKGTQANGDLGYGLSFIQDQDNDGKEDILTGAPGLSKAYIYSSQSGQILKTFLPGTGGNLFGIDVASTKNQTGFQNIVIGDQGYTYDKEYQGAAFLYTIYTLQNIGNFSWSKGTGLVNAFNLADYFYDPWGGAVTYSVTGNSNITIGIDPFTHYVSFYSLNCWIGSETVIFHVRDNVGTQLSSNQVVLTVTDANVDACNSPNTAGDVVEPSLSISYPYYSNWWTYGNKIPIRGMVSDSTSGLDRVWLYNQQSQETVNVDKINPDGYFEQWIDLQKNVENIIQVKAQDKAGNLTTKELNIYQIPLFGKYIIPEAVLTNLDSQAVVFVSIFDDVLGKDIDLSITKEPIIYTQRPKFKGATIPDGKVDLYIGSSQEIHAVVNSAKSGNWQYQTAEPLDYGQHSVYATVTDKDGNISQPTDKLVFATKPNPIMSLAGKAGKSVREFQIWWIFAGIAVLVLIGLIIVNLRNRRKRANFY